MTQEQQYVQENPLVNVTNRVRELEGKYNLIRDRVLLINNNMIEEYKKLIGEIKVITEDVREIKGDLFKIKESMKHLIQELDLFAKKEDVKYVEKYINLWNPMKFTTEEDVIKIIENHKKDKAEKEVKNKHARSK